MIKNTSLEEEWDLFKKTWVNNEDENRSNIICKEEEENFYHFDNFICSKLWETDAWSSQIATIVTFKDRIGRIKIFAEKKIIRICYSPFRIKSQKYGGGGSGGGGKKTIKTPVTFLLQNVMDKLIECLVKSNSDIKINHCTRYNEEYNKYMED